MFTFKAPREVHIGSPDYQAGFAKAKTEIFDQAETQINALQTKLDQTEAKLAKANADITTVAKMAVADDRKRIKSIIESNAGHLRPKAALNMALTTDMPLDQAQNLLSSMPKEDDPHGGNPFLKAMANVANPKINAAGPDDDEQADYSKSLAGIAKGNI